MQKRRIMAMLLVLVLIVSLAVTAYAASDYCQAKVGVDMCGKVLTWKYNNRSVNTAASHEYGGFLGMFTKTCNYEYYYIYQVYSCAAGHVSNNRALRYEIGHDCGQ